MTSAIPGVHVYPGLNRPDNPSFWKIGWFLWLLTGYLVVNMAEYMGSSNCFDGMTGLSLLISRECTFTLQLVKGSYHFELAQVGKNVTIH